MMCQVKQYEICFSFPDVIKNEAENTLAGKLASLGVELFQFLSKEIRVCNPFLAAKIHGAKKELFFDQALLSENKDFLIWKINIFYSQNESNLAFDLDKIIASIFDQYQEKPISVRYYKQNKMESISLKKITLEHEIIWDENRKKPKLDSIKKKLENLQEPCLKITTQTPIHLKNKYGEEILFPYPKFILGNMFKKYNQYAACMGYTEVLDADFWKNFLLQCEVDKYYCQNTLVYLNYKNSQMNSTPTLDSVNPTPETNLFALNCIEGNIRYRMPQIILQDEKLQKKLSNLCSFTELLSIGGKARLGLGKVHITYYQPHKPPTSK